MLITKDISELTKGRFKMNNNICSEDKIVFISIKFNQNVAMEKVATRVKTGESFSQVAKGVRKQVAGSPRNHGLNLIGQDGKFCTGINAGLLDWAVFDGEIVNGKREICDSPFLHSEHWNPKKDNKGWTMTKIS
jgi:hypothetical protein